ncbi:MAG: hypothetical protein KDB23_19440, partial [Planctomycetales bacterium]|nr:hypothetical protein [Planctomycetales bacterium]
MIKQLRNWLTSLVALTLLTCASVLADEAASIAKIEEVGGTIRTIAKDTDQKEAAFHLSGKDVGDDG